MNSSHQENTILKRLHAEMAAELQDEILPFWIQNSVDPHFGGFVGRIDNSHKRYSKAEKAVVLNTRLLWTFSAAHRVFRKDIYLELAKRSYKYLENNFYDPEYQGFYWLVNYKGMPIDTMKHAYGQAFAIYAYSEFHRATGNESALKRAIETFEVLEDMAADSVKGGYVEAFDRKWTELEDVRLGNRSADEKRSMNTHLHILEAYTNLYRVWKNDHLQERLKHLANHMLQVVYDPQISHFIDYFTDDWKAKSRTYSYGHDIEAAWLLIDVAETIKDDQIRQHVRDAALNLGRVTLDEGMSRATGGLYYTGVEGSPRNRDFHWWVQAEAIVGFLYIYELTGDSEYLDACFKLWTFIQDRIKDPEHGEWFSRVNGSGRPYQDDDKIGRWKCPYHNSRACLILIERFGESQD